MTLRGACSIDFESLRGAGGVYEATGVRESAESETESLIKDWLITSNALWHCQQCSEWSPVCSLLHRAARLVLRCLAHFFDNQHCRAHGVLTAHKPIRHFPITSKRISALLVLQPMVALLGCPCHVDNKVLVIAPVCCLAMEHFGLLVSSQVSPVVV